MNRNLIFFIVSVAVSIALHVLVLSLSFEIKSSDPVENAEPFIRVVDAVIIDAPEPSVTIQKKPQPPEHEIIEDVIAATVQPEDPGSDLKPQKVPETEKQPEVSGSRSEPGGTDDFLPFYRVDIRPEFIHKAELKYPLQAKRQKVEGTVIIEADIDSSGNVQTIRTVKSAGFGFDEAAIEMIEQSAFSPASAGGLNVGVRMRFTVKFEL